MTKLTLSKKAKDKCDNVIIISGCARSGTTILGKIISSFKNIEYSFEPPTIASLLALISTLPKKEWKFLYETYLYEELLLNSLAGRGINCNRADDSSIYKVKSEKIINDRLKNSLRKKDAEKIADKSRIAYKLPEITPFIPKLKSYYPKAKIIITTRSATDVINSLIEKNWFSNKNLSETSVIWPYTVYKNIHIPYWVKKNDEELWFKMDELHRCAYYYIRINGLAKKINSAITIKYGDLIASPVKTAEILAQKLNLNFGEKTNEILKSIKKTEKKRDLAILEKLEPTIKKQINKYSEKN